MKCKILFPGKRKKMMNLSSDKFARRVVKINIKHFIKMH